MFFVCVFNNTISRPIRLKWYIYLFEQKPQPIYHWLDMAIVVIARKPESWKKHDRHIDKLNT